MGSSKTYGVTDKAQIAYILATVSHETQFGIVGLYPESSTHNPMYEYSSGEIGSDYDFSYFSRKYDSRGINDLGNAPRGEGDGFRYRGRGYVQLTGKANYIKFQNLLGVDITASENGQKVYRPVTYSSGLGIYSDGATFDYVTKYSDESDADKVANDKDLASRIIVLGMRDGLITTSYGLSHYINTLDSNVHQDFVNARIIINGNDQAEDIAVIADRYYAAFKKIKY